MSNNYGSLTVKGNTEIIASPGQVSFDLWYGMSSVYDGGVSVTFDDDFSGTVNGKIEYGHHSRITDDNLNGKAVLKIKSGTFIGNIVYSSEVSDADITIEGGSFSSDVSTYCMNGYSCLKDGSEYVVKKVQKVENIENGDKITSENNSIVIESKNGTTITDITAELPLGSVMITTSDGITKLSTSIDDDVTPIPNSVKTFNLIIDVNSNYEAKITINIQGGSISSPTVYSLDEEGNCEAHKVVSYTSDSVTFLTNHNTLFFIMDEEAPSTPSPDDDDELPFIPGQNDSPEDDSSTYVAVAAAAAVVAILAVLVVGISKRKL